MPLERPDLSEAQPEIVQYIEMLEAQLLTLQANQKAPARRTQTNSPAEALPNEPETTINILAITESGLIKRTPRHFYSRQRRAGMGVFDIESTEDDPPFQIGMGDENDIVVLITHLGRAFRLPVSKVAQTDVRGKGQPIGDLLKFRPNERVVRILPEAGGKFMTLLTERGWVRRVRANYLGKSLIPGTSFHDINQGGYVTDACWSDGASDTFIGTRSGLGIRFSEAQIPTRGCLGIRLSPDDTAIAVTSTSDDGKIFLVSHDGRGTIRSMNGFRKNKAPSAGGKVALKTDQLIAARSVDTTEELFLISKHSKMIRFAANEIPVKSGTVQGVILMALRGDDIQAVTVSPTPGDL